MRIALERAVFTHFHLAECLPALQMVLRELERTVLDQFGIKTAVSGEIDILKEYSVHGRLYWSAYLLQVDVKLTDLSVGCQCQRYSQSAENVFPNHTDRDQ